MDTEEIEQAIEQGTELQVQKGMELPKRDDEEEDSIDFDKDKSKESAEGLLTKQGSESLSVELPNGFRLNLCSAFVRVDYLANLGFNIYDEFVKRAKENKEPNNNGGMGNHFG